MRWEERFLRNTEKTINESVNIKELDIGKVISINPLQILNGQLPLFSNNLYINPDLLSNTKEFTELTGTIGGSATTISNGSISFKASLSIGDLVVLREINDSTYMVICKATKGV